MGIGSFFDALRSLREKLFSRFSRQEQPLPVKSGEEEARDGIRRAFKKNYDARVMKELVACVYSLKYVLDLEQMKNVAALFSRIDEADGALSVRFIKAASCFADAGGYDLVRKAALICIQVGMSKKYNFEVGESLVEDLLAVVDCVKSDRAAMNRVVDLCSAVIAGGAQFLGCRILKIFPEVVESFYRGRNEAVILNVVEYLRGIAVPRCGLVYALLETSPAMVEKYGFEGFVDVAAFCCYETGEGYDVAAEILRGAPDVLKALINRGVDVAGAAYKCYSRVYSKNRELGLAFFSQSVGIIQKAGLGGLERIAAYCGGSKTDPAFARGIVENCQDILASSGVTGVMQMARSFGDVAAASEKSARLIAKMSPVIIKKLGCSDFLLFCACVRDMTGGDRAVAELWQEATAPSLEKILDLGGADFYREYYESCRSVIGISPDSAALVVEKGAEIFTGWGYADFAGAMRFIEKYNGADPEVVKALFEVITELFKSGGLPCFVEIAGLGFELARTNRKYAVSFVATCPALMAGPGVKNLRAVAAVGLKMAEGGLTYSLEMVSRCLEVASKTSLAAVERILQFCNLLNGKGGRRKVSKEEGLALFDRCRDLIQEFGDGVFEAVRQNLSYLKPTAAAAVFGWFEKTAEIIKRGGLEGLTRFTLRVNELAAANPKKASAFASGESAEYHVFVETITAGLKLRQVKPVLSTYLEALLGYRTPLEEAETPCTDGEKIYLPAKISDFAEEEKNFTLYKVFATHEEAHLEFGSFDFELEMAPGVVELARRRYEREPAATGLGLAKFNSLFPEPALSAYLFNLVEDFRIGAKLKSRYPVLGRQIRESDEHILATRPPADPAKGRKHAFVEALTRLVFGGKADAALADAEIAAMRQAIRSLKPLLSDEAGVGDAAMAAARVYFIVDALYEGGYSPNRPHSGGLDQEAVEKNVGNFARTARKIAEKSGRSGTPGGAAPDEKTVEEVLRKLYKQGGVKPSDVERAVDEMGDGVAAKYFASLSARIARGRELEKEAGTELYPEWGDDIGDYRPRWARVRELRQPSDPDAARFCESALRENRGLVRRVRKEFQHMRPTGVERVRGCVSGGEIDVGAAVDYFIERRAKRSPGEKNYIRVEKKKREIAVAFLLDMSGSTDGDVIKFEKNALLVMSEALESLGDSFAVYGFESDGRDNCRFRVVKEFCESYGPEVRSRIGSVRAGGCTLTGAAIRHAVKKLKRRDERVKIVILISDGSPNDTTADPVEDTRMALKEAQRAGVKSFCITVDSSAASYLPRMYSHSNWIVVNDISKLPDKITKIYRRLTK